MAEQNVPRVKLPDIIQRKPVTPGPNSWAQTQQQQHLQEHRPAHELAGSAMVTNRDRYEHKPMPPPPKQSPSPNARPQPKTYIQPAIPLVSPIQNSQAPKNRAVTDPIAPKPLFGGSRKVSVTQLRKKYSNSKPKANATTNGSDAVHEPATGNRPSSEKATRVIDLQPGEETKRNTSPASVPVNNVHDPFRTSYDAPRARAAEPASQAQSTPVPTRRYLKENGLPTPTLADPSDGATRQADVSAQDRYQKAIESEEHMRVKGTLHPPKTGTCARVGEVGLVEGHGMHRVESIAGIIEDAASGNSNGNHAYTTSSEVATYSSTAQYSDAGELLVPAVYTPSNYGGVWENDPAVGYSLPPFSPVPRGNQPTPNTNRRGQYQNSANDMFIDKHGDPSGANPPPAPISLNGFGQNSNFNRFSENQRPFPSANSWASESRGTSLTSTNPPLSALLPPHWPHHHSVNSVPSPPHNQYDFQRSGSVAAALAQIELTLHHHIDTTFGSSSRLINDKHDRMIDQTIRRFENLEETVGKELKTLKGEVKEIKKDVGNLGGDLKEVVNGTERNTELIKGLHEKLKVLDEHIEESARKCSQIVIEQSASEPGFDRHQRAQSHRRAESARGAFGQGEQRQHYGSGASRSSNSARHSGASSRGHRSNTVSSQPDNRLSDERSMRREYFAELGAARGAVPDIRNHPAYAGTPQGQSLGNTMNGMSLRPNGLPHENSTLSDGGWYQQAYGQHR